MNCPTCGAWLDDEDAAVCPRCGGLLLGGGDAELGQADLEDEEDQ